MGQLVGKREKSDSRKAALALALDAGPKSKRAALDVGLDISTIEEFVQNGELLRCDRLLFKSIFGLLIELWFVILHVSDSPSIQTDLIIRRAIIDRRGEGSQIGISA